jgi:hypothetical protein
MISRSALSARFQFFSLFLKGMDMRKKLLRLATGAFALAGATGTAWAVPDGCPSNIVVGGTMACHHTGGTGCDSCRYRCDDGETYTWNVCQT